MSGEFAVEKALHVRQNVIEITLTAQPRFLEPEDFSDCASVGCYALESSVGELAVLFVEKVDDFTLRLTLDRELAEGETVNVGLNEQADALYGQVTSTSTVELTATTTWSNVSAEKNAQGADFKIPMASDQSASFSMLSREQAYRERLILLCETRRNDFAHLRDWGRAIEPKRNYSLIQLEQFAKDLKDAVQADADTKSVSVRYFRGQYSVRYQISATPVFSLEPQTFDVSVGDQ